MLSIQKIRDDKSFVQKELLKKDKSISLDNIVKSDSELRDLTKKLNDLQSEQNKKSKEIGKLKSKKSDDKSIFEDLKKLSSERIYSEFKKILLNKSAFRILDMMMNY